MLQKRAGWFFLGLSLRTVRKTLANCLKSRDLQNHCCELLVVQLATAICIPYSEHPLRQFLRLPSIGPRSQNAHQLFHTDFAISVQVHEGEGSLQSLCVPTVNILLKVFTVGCPATLSHLLGWLLATGKMSGRRAIVSRHVVLYT